ncbi:MAG: hypothetical protein HY687_06865 [Chloroflexi bacterium]|nr:hypothetical protein [Chloroflexota bacterium]
MAPDILGAAGWNSLQATIIFLWVLLPATITFGGSLLLGQAILPSLVSTGHLSPGWLRLQMPLGVVSLVAGAAAVFLLIQVLRALPALLEFYPRFWQ